MKKFCLAVIVIVAFAAFSTPGAEGHNHRGVYLNNSVHYLTVGTDSKHQTLSVSEQAPQSPGSNWLLGSGTSVSKSISACTYGDPCGSESNGAVFGNTIYYAYTANPGCSQKGTHLFVASYDLAQPQTNTPAIIGTPIDLGATHHSSYYYKGAVDFASAAVVVYKNLLYAFSDSGTYTSGDGINWTSHPALPNGDSDMEPLDAITYYPPDADPGIMIIYGKIDSATWCYKTVYAATWDGNLTDTSGFHLQQLDLSGSEAWWPVGLFTGTAYSPGGFSPGALTPAVQLFLQVSVPQKNGIKRMEYTYSQTGGQWTADSSVFSPSGGIQDMLAYAWYTPDCTGNYFQRQNLVFNYFYTNQSNNKQIWNNLALTSDAMIPQNTDNTPTCGNPGGTVTTTGDTDDMNDLATFQKYWTLVGVIMGSPPFSANGANDSAEISKLSNLSTSSSDSNAMTYSSEQDQSVLVSAGLGVQAGLGRKIKTKDKLDFGFQHGWDSAYEKTTTDTATYAIQCGTEYGPKDSTDDLGKQGWAIFYTPSLIVQDYLLYAYDYNPSTGSGTALNQNLHSVQVNPNALSIIQVAFDLEDPGGPNDTFPGLMSGINPLSRSTNLDGWSQRWESSANMSSQTHYRTLLGDGTYQEQMIPKLIFVDGSDTSVQFTQEKEQSSTTGQTSDIDCSVDLSLSFALKLAGLKAGLGAGYEGHFSNSVTSTHAMGTELEASLGMSSCSGSDPQCVKSLYVQPYWLQAADSNAPWIPTAYNSQLPWAIYWHVNSYGTAGGNTTGDSPPADRIVAKIAGQSNLNLAGSPDTSVGSSYSLAGGKMAWLQHDGSVDPIPMTADEFDPASGASVEVNGYAWSSSQADGTWVRRGNVWNFLTSQSATSDVVDLKLDFGARTWDFDLTKTDLSPFYKASQGHTHLVLSVNDKYKFYFDCNPAVKAQWDISADPPALDTLSLSRYHGTFSSSTGTGTAVLEGNLPSNLKYFGDFSVSVNGRQTNVPLLSQKNYAKAFAEGKKLVYEKDGLKLSVDFGKKTWRAYLGGNSFHQGLAPSGGATAIQVKVGGVAAYSGNLPVLNYTLNLEYGAPRYGSGLIRN